MYRITRREAFSDTTFLWEVEAPDVARAAEPGHFVMLRLREGAERIPLTVADYDRDAGTVTIVVQALGKTTVEMRDHYRAGDRFADFVGPLGLPQHVSRVGHVLLVGGGLGVAPVYPQLRAFKAAGNRTTGIIGFRNKDLVFWEGKFGAHCDRLIVCTDDGSYGTPGFVTAALKEVLASDRPDLVIAIGPLPMMAACAETTRPFGVRTMVSLNAIMVDGTGMCGSCRVTVDRQIRFACVDGPDFDGHQVDFKELMLRQKRFKGEEARASSDYAHVCRVEQQLIVEGKRNYKKFKDLAPHAVKMPERDPLERARNFKEVNLGYSLAEALAEAERCIMCSKPTCIDGCPVGIDIPRFIRHLLVRDLDGARAAIHESNLFPSVCGRVCPQESQCEIQCQVGRNKKTPMEPVAIGRLERFVGDMAIAEGWENVPYIEPSGYRVGIVGAGPAGMACAADMAKAGCEVVVYEAFHTPGGVLKYGIPDFRLPNEVIDAEIDKVKRLGVRFECNTLVGRLFTIEQMLTEMGFHAVFIGTGAGYPSFMGIPGESLNGVLSANELLTRCNLMRARDFPNFDTPLQPGKHVAVIGAGNTAMDALRVSLRLGAESVHCIYRRSKKEAPARVEEVHHAEEEGVDFNWLTAPVEILGDADNNVRALRCVKMELGEPDASGRRKPVVVAGSEFEFACDMVVFAIGTNANPILGQTTKLKLNQRGYIDTDDNLATSMAGVYAGGDIVTGAATVIQAMGAGRKAARSMKAYLGLRDSESIYAAAADRHRFGVAFEEHGLARIRLA